MPADIPAVQATAVILNYVTAYQMLHRIAKVAEGEQILIHGASGGVGTALLELGRLAKLTMYGTASKAKNMLRYLSSARYRLTIGRRILLKCSLKTAPQGLDAVFDPIGGDNWQRSFQTLRENGRFVGYGFTSVLGERNSNYRIMDKRLGRSCSVSNNGQR